LSFSYGCGRGEVKAEGFGIGSDVRFGDEGVGEVCSTDGVPQRRGGPEDGQASLVWG